MEIKTFIKAVLIVLAIIAIIIGICWLADILFTSESKIFVGLGFGVLYLLIIVYKSLKRLRQ